MVGLSKVCGCNSTSQISWLNMPRYSIQQMNLPFPDLSFTLLFTFLFLFTFK